MVKKLEDLQVLERYHLQLPSPLASTPHTFPVGKPCGKSSGLYTLRYGEKSVGWYWEFDTEKHYFHQSQTAKTPEAMRIYQESKFDMWEDSWEPPSRARQ
jgi:hypothetical protein